MLRRKFFVLLGLGLTALAQEPRITLLVRIEQQERRYALIFKDPGNPWMWVMLAGPDAEGEQTGDVFGPFDSEGEAFEDIKERNPGSEVTAF